MPQPDLDPIVDISMVLYEHGQKWQEAKRVLLALNQVSPIEGTRLACYEQESDMLCGFADLVNAFQPDFITGYNILGFDFRYLFDRADFFGARVSEHVRALGRMKGRLSDLQATTFSSRARGNNETNKLLIDGVDLEDMMQYCKRTFKMRSYSLNAVCAEHLDEQKEDVNHKEITPLWQGSNDDRRRLGSYCVKDALLPLRLCDKFMLVVDYIETARVKNTPISYVYSRGQQVNTYALLLRTARRRGFVLPHIKRPKLDTLTKTKKAYSGASVLDPKKGLYTTPIVTLDYASLYPSIMVSHNLDYSTWISEERIKALGFVEGRDYQRMPEGDCFVLPHIRKGLMPQFLDEDLLTVRGKLKAQLKVEKEPAKKDVLDRRQNAVKLAANSSYGFTGVTDGGGIMPWLPISRSVTSQGREYILHAKTMAEAQVTEAPSKFIQVIYGDTDSIMVDGHFSSVKEAAAWGKKTIAAINKPLKPPLQIAQDNIFEAQLLVSKKRYAFAIREKGQLVVKTKGLETTRRDNCLYSTELMSRVLHTMLVRKDPEAAVREAAEQIRLLRSGRIDLYKLRISRSLQKRLLTPEERHVQEEMRAQLEDEIAVQNFDEECKKKFYAGKQPHAVLASKLTQRDPDNAPHLGDRLYYVVVQGSKDLKMCDRAEDAAYILQNHIPVDFEYYVERQVRKPLSKLVKHLDKERPAEQRGKLGLMHQHVEGRKTIDIILSAGDKQVSIVRQIPPPTEGKITAFIQLRSRCVVCNSYQEGRSAKLEVVCVQCRDTERARRAYHSELEELRRCEQNSSKLWAHCQRCQKSTMQPILCGNSDCPIFFARSSAQILATLHAGRIEAFNW